jgi:7-cyano-7-deazaguanine reductase
MAELELTQLDQPVVRPSSPRGESLIERAPNRIPASPKEAVLERVPNTHVDSKYVQRFSITEFTTLCAVTRQPDFACLTIDIMPDKWVLESKSLKFFLGSFRNYGSFHEDCSVSIGKRIFEAVEPHWMRIGAYWYPRGGIPIDVFWQSSEAPPGVWLPEQGVPAYRGRG